MLFAFSGLPGVGKTTVARALIRATGAAYLRIDALERPMQRAGFQIDGWGYEIAHAVAEENLRLGNIVVADCVNPWPLTRDDWRAVAERAQVPIVEVEVVCTDAVEHRRRVESRLADISGQKLPTWAEVANRDYVPWNRDRVVVDTARSTIDDCIHTIRATR